MKRSDSWKWLAGGERGGGDGGKARRDEGGRGEGRGGER